MIFTIHSKFGHSKEEREQLSRSRREALKAALLAEMKINEEWVSNGVETIEEQKNGSDLLMPINAVDVVFRSHQDQLGLLSTNQIRLVIEAYLSLESNRSKYLLLGIEPVAGTHCFSFPAEKVEVVLINSKHSVKGFHDAIAALEDAS